MTRLQALKTGRLIQFSAEAGAILGRAAWPSGTCSRPMGVTRGRRSRSPTICWMRRAQRGNRQDRRQGCRRRQGDPGRLLGVERARAQAEMLARQAAGASGQFWRTRRSCCARWPLRRGPAELSGERAQHESPGAAPARRRTPFWTGFGIRRICGISRRSSCEQLADELRAETIERGIGDRGASGRLRWAWWN